MAQLIITSSIDVEFIFFWKPTEQPYGYLGNWYNSSFDINGKTYANVEQYFMEQKAIIFNDIIAAEQIMENIFPSEMKKIGQRVKNYDEAVWNSVRYDIMKKAIYEKFAQDPNLLSKLASTGDKILVEASPFDKIWGIGYTKDKAIQKKDKWGQNLLGKALMEVRSQLC